MERNSFQFYIYFSTFLHSFHISWVTLCGAGAEPMLHAKRTHSHAFRFGKKFCAISFLLTLIWNRSPQKYASAIWQRFGVSILSYARVWIASTRNSMQEKSARNITENNKIAINWSIERTWLKDGISHAPIGHASAQPLHSFGCRPVCILDTKRIGQQVKTAEHRERRVDRDDEPMERRMSKQCALMATFMHASHPSATIQSTRNGPAQRPRLPEIAKKPFETIQLQICRWHHNLQQQECRHSTLFMHLTVQRFDSDRDGVSLAFAQSFCLNLCTMRLSVDEWSKTSNYSTHVRSC